MLFLNCHLKQKAALSIIYFKFLFRLRTSARNAASTLHTFEPQLVTSTKATLDTAETRLQQTAGDSAHTTQLDSALPRDSALLGDSALPGDSMLEATAQITVGDNSTMPSMPDDSTTNRVTRIGAQVIIIRL